jgi:hypothetical protein
MVNLYVVYWSGISIRIVLLHKPNHSIPEQLTHHLSTRESHISLELDPGPEGQHISCSLPFIHYAAESQFIDLFRNHPKS